MKTLTKNKKILNILFLILIVSENLFAGDPPPVGGDPTDPGSGATPIGGSAPVGDGFMILLITVLIYLSYKYYYRYINSIGKNKI